MSEKTFEEIREGDTAQFQVLVDETLVDQFAALSGDANPLHMSGSYAEGTVLGARVAHGMIGGALFSQLVGMHLPGRNALYLSQTLFFRKPLLLNTAVTVSGRVTQKSESARTLTLTTTISDAAGTVYTDGEALVRVLQ